MRNMTARGDQGQMSKPVTEPIGAITASSPHSLLVPVEGRDGKTVRRATDPLRTQSTRNETGLLVPVGGTWRADAAPTDRPMPTRTTRETDALVVPLRNHGTAKDVGEPIDTVAANGNHHALVIRQQNSRGQMASMATPALEPLRTLTAQGNQSLVDTDTLPGPAETLTDDEIWQLVYDAEFRMLEPDEIKRGMAFPGEYILLGNKRERVRMAGNAVTPNAARDIIAACVESLGYEIDWRLAA
jgi:DNA (cytosine-5)-methyltransferase 1